MARSRKRKAPTRRTPRQARALETRDAIVEAAARLFSEVGLRKATTARVAKLAGVSPGSMYQYFPSKEALVTAIYERYSDRQHARFLELVEVLGTDDVPKLIRAFVTINVEALERDLPLARVMLEEVPRVAGLRATRGIDRMATQAVRALLAGAGDRVQVRDTDIAAVLLVRASRYSLISLLDEPLAGARREAFIDELSDLLASYLLSPRPWRPS